MKLKQKYRANKPVKRTAGSSSSALQKKLNQKPWAKQQSSAAKRRVAA